MKPSDGHAEVHGCHINLRHLTATRTPVAMDSFAQILEPDDDGGFYSCSRALITAFFTAACTAHRDMIRANAKQNPTGDLAALRHILKGMRRRGERACLGREGERVPDSARTKSKIALSARKLRK